MSKYRMMQGWKGPHSHSAQYIPEGLYDKKLADISRETMCLCAHEQAYKTGMMRKQNQKIKIHENYFKWIRNTNSPALHKTVWGALGFFPENLDM